MDEPFSALITRPDYACEGTIEDIERKAKDSSFVTHDIEDNWVTHTCPIHRPATVIANSGSMFNVRGMLPILLL
jgi:hypothetical protein